MKTVVSLLVLLLLYYLYKLFSNIIRISREYIKSKRHLLKVIEQTFGLEYVQKLKRGEYWKGMPEDLLYFNTLPDDVNKIETFGRIRRTYYFIPITNARKNAKYKYEIEVKTENGFVYEWRIGNSMYNSGMDNRNNTILDGAINKWSIAKQKYSKRFNVFGIKPIFYMILFGLMFLILFFSFENNNKGNSKKRNTIKTEESIIINTEDESFGEEPLGEEDVAQDFDDFIREFVSDPNSQMSFIKFPVKFKGIDGEWSLLKKDKWTFLGEDFIFQGKKTIDFDDCNGQFIQKSDSEYIYELKRISDARIIMKMTFSVIDYDWRLIEVEAII